MKVLVTGGAGFIGSHVCEALLDRNDEVVVIDDFNDYYDPEIKEGNIDLVCRRGDIEIVRGDIRRDADLEKLPWSDIDRVIHLAARAGVRNSISDPQLYWNTNTLGLMKLLERSTANNIEHFVSASSSSVYGNCPDVPFREDACELVQISPYAASKMAGEILARTFHELSRMSICCLRYFTVYGPRQRPDMAIHKFTRLINQGDPIPMFGDGSMRRDYTYIDDIVKGSLAALDRKCAFEIYNLGGSHTISLARMIELIGQALGKEPFIEVQPVPPGDVRQTSADVTKAAKDLGFEPLTRAEEGIPLFVDWYLKQPQ